MAVDATATATPAPSRPAAEPTVGYTPTDTYQVTRLLVGSGQPGRLYAWLEGFRWAEGLPGRLLVSDDLGATWQEFEGGNALPLGMDYASNALYAQAPREPIGTWRDTRGVTVDGDSGATYLMLGNIISSFNPTGSQLWRSDNLNTLDVRDVSWTLLKDFGPESQVELLASGWNPSAAGPSLYANMRPEYCPAEGGTCDPEPPWVLYRSLDGGQTWTPIAIPETGSE